MVALLLTPVAIVPGAQNRFLFGKIAVAALAVMLMWFSRPNGRLPSAVLWTMVAAGAVIVASALVSAHPAGALWGRAPRFEGVPVLVLYALAALAGARLLGPGRDGPREGRAVTAMGWCSAALGSLAVLEALGWRPLSSTVARPGSFSGNASELGAIAVLLFGVLLAVGLQRRSPWVLAGAGCAAVATLLSASRGALLGAGVTVVALTIIWWFRADRGRRAPLLRVLAGLSVLGGVVALVLPGVRDRILGSSPWASATVTGRELLWEDSFALWQNHLLLGVGPSGYHAAIATTHSPEWYGIVGVENPPDSPHNLILQIVSAGGILLLAVALYFGWLLGRAAHRTLAPAVADPAPGRRSARAGQVDRTPGWSAGVVAGLAGHLTALMFHFTSPGTTVVAAVLIGSLVSVPSAHDISRSMTDGIVRAVGLLATSVIFVGGVAGAVSERYLRTAAQHLAETNWNAADLAATSARAWRPWDVDLAGQVVGDLIVPATQGDAQALSLALQWDSRGIPPGDTQMSVNRITLAQLDGRDEEAIALVTEALLHDPHHPGLLVLQGLSHLAAGDTVLAESTFLEATDVDPDNSFAWLNLAHLYRSQGRLTEASAAQLRADAGS